MLDSPIQIDLESIDDVSLNNLKEVYAVMSLLLEEINSLEEVNDQDAVELLSSLQSIKVRDGVLKYFTVLPKDLRLDALKSYTFHLDYAARNHVDVSLVADATAWLGAMMVLQAGFKAEADESYDAEKEIYLGLFKDAERLGSTASLLRLLQVAIQHDVPPTVFKNSIDAISLEECVSV